MTKLLIKAIASLNAVFFTLDKGYSKPEFLANLLKDKEKYKMVTINYRGDFAGYALVRFTEYETQIVRRAIYPQFQGKGLGVKLTKKVMKLARDNFLVFHTYAHGDNFSSINSSIRAGCKIVKNEIIDGDVFTHLASNNIYDLEDFNIYE